MKVTLSRRAQKDLKSLLSTIVERFDRWLTAVETEGLQMVRCIRGFNDEALKGDRKGQRSVRLNRAYRVIYIEETFEVIEVIEVNKHKY